MSDEEKTLVEQLEEVREEDLQDVTIEEVRADRIRIFQKPTEEIPDVEFDFTLNSLSAKMQKGIKTKTGTGNMYHLDTTPKIVCFTNAFDILATFVEKKNFKFPVKLRYLGRTGEGFDTVYNFKEVK